MKLAERTTSVLKNFNNINTSILVKPGSTLETMAASKKVIARATVPDEFGQEFAIFDLNRFLGALSLFKEPELEFGDHSVAIKADGRRLDYVFASPETVLAPPAKGVRFPGPDAAPQVSFTLTAKTLTDVTKAAAVLGMKELAISGRNGKLYFEVADTKNPTAHGYSVEVGETEHRFRLVFVLEAFKFMPDDYEVTASLKRIAHFKGSVAEYYVVGEDTSQV